MNTVIRIVAALVQDEERRVLLVRKKGTRAFMQPGGKLGHSESQAERASRRSETRATFQQLLLSHRKDADVCSHSALEDLKFSVTSRSVGRYLEVDLIETDESRRQPGEQDWCCFAIHSH